MGNNAIRKISAATREVTTLAGGRENGVYTGVAGASDGAGDTALFSSPTSVTVYYDWRDPAADASTRVLVLFVADADNHRIRKLRIDPHTGDVVVSCFSGLCGNCLADDCANYYSSTFAARLA